MCHLNNSEGYYTLEPWELHSEAKGLVQGHTVFKLYKMVLSVAFTVFIIKDNDVAHIECTN